MSDIRSGRLDAGNYARNFGDLLPPLSDTEAVVEASRCFYCYDAPCIEACPTSIDIPAFIRKIQNGNLLGSAQTILDANIMGGACARVCPTEVLCEEVCVRQIAEGKPVKIGRLQRHAVDHLMSRGVQPFERSAPTGKTIAVIGAGPAGLSCAHVLARLGHQITVFEARAKAGGLNEYGVAAYKMADDFAAREVAFIQEVGGIEVKTGQAVAIADVVDDFDAVFVGCGLGDTNRLGLEGEDLDGVIDAVRFIETLRQSPKPEMPIGRRVVIIGGGNTAIDASIQSKRLGAEEVTLVYRRGAEQMSATGHEQELARNNGVHIVLHAKPVQLVGETGVLRAVGFERSDGEVFTLAVDQVMKAIGQRLVGDTAIELDGRKIKVDAHGRTSMARVWAGGDATAGQDLTVVAVEEGKVAAASIDTFLRGQR